MASQPKKDDAVPTSSPQVQPLPGIGPGHSEYHFVQHVSEVQKTLGRIETKLDAQEKKIEGLELKVNKLLNWKTGIGAVVAFIVFVFTLMRVTGYSFKVISAVQQEIQKPTATVSLPAKTK